MNMFCLTWCTWLGAAHCSGPCSDLTRTSKREGAPCLLPEAARFLFFLGSPKRNVPSAKLGGVQPEKHTRVQKRPKESCQGLRDFARAEDLARLRAAPSHGAHLRGGQKGGQNKRGPVLWGGRGGDGRW